jgi:hypothetical protein
VSEIVVAALSEVIDGFDVHGVVDEDRKRRLKARSSLRDRS